MHFEWDPAKNRSNRSKHGVSFEEAATLFTSGADFLEIYDDLHSAEEDRFIAVGPISRGIIVVAFTERGEDLIRIVSARKATRIERTLFEDFWRGQHG